MPMDDNSLSVRPWAAILAPPTHFRCVWNPSFLAPLTHTHAERGSGKNWNQTLIRIEVSMEDVTDVIVDLARRWTAIGSSICIASRRIHPSVTNSSLGGWRVGLRRAEQANCRQDSRNIVPRLRRKQSGRAEFREGPRPAFV